jgi:hypothetical protein
VSTLHVEVWWWFSTRSRNVKSGWLVFITERECVYCAVRIKFLNTVEVGELISQVDIPLCFYSVNNPIHSQHSWDPVFIALHVSARAGHPEAKTMQKKNKDWYTWCYWRTGISVYSRFNKCFLYIQIILIFLYLYTSKLQFLSLCT